MIKLAQALLLAAGLAVLTAPSAYAADSAAALKALDPDDDGTIDLKEAEAGSSQGVQGDQSR